MNTISFLNQCKKNREILELTYQDMANVLLAMSAKEYEQFEQGKTKKISKENLLRIVRILCIQNTYSFSLNEYIDVDGLNAEEIQDLSNIIEKLVGELDD